MKKKRVSLSTIILVVILVVGISLLLYPTVSDYWNSFHQSRAIATYAEAVANIDEAQYEKMWNDAVAYNRRLAKEGANWNPSEEEMEEYLSLIHI